MYWPVMGESQSRLGFKNHDSSTFGDSIWIVNIRFNRSRFDLRFDLKFLCDSISKRFKSRRTCLTDSFVNGQISSEFCIPKIIKICWLLFIKILVAVFWDTVCRERKCADTIGTVPVPWAEITKNADCSLRKKLFIIIFQRTLVTCFLVKPRKQHTC